MNGTLITFDDVRERGMIDIIGGHIEVDVQNNVFRGELVHICWWVHYHPKSLTWVHCMIWDVEKRTWKMHNYSQRLSINFNRNIIESFSGPFESESGEIFFIAQNRIAVTLFPQGCSLPDQPKSQERFESLSACFK